MDMNAQPQEVTYPWAGPTGTLAATGCEGMGEFSLRVLWLRGTMSSLIRDCEEHMERKPKE